jgi:hypothetical protein
MVFAINQTNEPSGGLELGEGVGELVADAAGEDDVQANLHRSVS